MLFLVCYAMLCLDDDMGWASARLIPCLVIARADITFWCYTRDISFDKWWYDIFRHLRCQRAWYYNTAVSTIAKNDAQPSLAQLNGNCRWRHFTTNEMYFDALAICRLSSNSLPIGRQMVFGLITIQPAYIDFDTCNWRLRLSSIEHFDGIVHFTLKQAASS